MTDTSLPPAFVERIESLNAHIRDLDSDNDAREILRRRMLVSAYENARRVELPYSEVCMHMRVAGKTMWVGPFGHNMAQIFSDNGAQFSSPITRGEAGLR